MFNIQIGDYVKVSDMTDRKGCRRSWKGTVADTCQEFFKEEYGCQSTASARAKREN